MGFKKGWDIPEIISQIQSLARECSSPHNDGFTAFECKKDLYQIQSIINDTLKRVPSFGNDEEEWLTKQEQQRILKILKS